MGRRKHRLSVHRKNEERKRYSSRSLPVRISLLSGIDVLPVSIPLSALSYRIQVPMEHFLASPVVNLGSLQLKIQNSGLLQPWMIISSPSDALVLCKIDTSQFSLPKVQIALTICADLCWSVAVCGQAIDNSTAWELPSRISFLGDLRKLVNFFTDFKFCVGSMEDKLQELIKYNNSTLNGLNHSRAYLESSTLSQPTVRHTNCSYILPSSSTHSRCSVCKTLRSSLLKQAKRHENSQVSSSTNHRYVTSSVLVDRLQKQSARIREQTQTIARLKQRLEEDIEVNGVSVSDEVHGDLSQIVEQNTSFIDKLPLHSFKRLFWEEQKKAMVKSNARGHRFHPLMIRWSLYVHHLSPKAYKLLRETGLLVLPSERTLRDYSHHTSARPGFSADVDTMLMDAAEVSTCPERNKYVLLLADEMHIKQNLVYDKHSGELIGFVSLGDINDRLDAYEKSLKDSGKLSPPLAKSVLVFMVRGLFSKLHFAYCQFPCSDLTGDQMYAPFWEAVGRLENCGFKVLGVTMDGCAVNRRFIKLHQPQGTHRVLNPFTTENRPILFFSDPPHLIKTARNCLCSKKRKLWNNGKDICWSHLTTLFEEDKCGGLGLRLLPKIKYEHLHLTSFSKMRVDLAAQVLSESVSKALTLRGGDAAAGTAEFLLMMDRFFDATNVKNYAAGCHSRKPFQQPYTSADDERLHWLKEEFLPYLDKWEQSVLNRKEREKLCKTETNLMMLSQETLLGLRMTALSLIELVKYAFTIPGVTSFLSQRVCQDPLECFFGCQRQRGWTHDNPTAAEFEKNMQALRVIDSVAKGPSRGNCRGFAEANCTNKENRPLPKRRKVSK